MFALFRRRRNAAAHAYRRSSPPSTAAAPTGGAAPGGVPVPTRPNTVPAWATQPTVAMPRPGRAGWLTPAQTWRANGGRW
ncbi:hypothetical protein [Micromonospora sp. NPDC050495]|uniref:hypothetical protein n=1 Tax=Micromonospora sp. NPDC050495 TaxID=3154936 RepID=UPI0033F67BEB